MKQFLLTNFQKIPFKIPVIQTIHMQGKESEWDVYVGWIQCTGYSWTPPTSRSLEKGEPEFFNISTKQ